MVDVCLLGIFFSGFSSKYAKYLLFKLRENRGMSFRGWSEAVNQVRLGEQTVFLWKKKTADSLDEVSPTRGGLYCGHITMHY